MKRFPLAVVLILQLVFSCNENKTPDTATVADTVAVNRFPVDSLRVEINTIIRSQDARIGVAIIGLEDGDTLTVNGRSQFTLMSVVKFPQAVALLHCVDEKKFSGSQLLRFDKKDMERETYSPFRDAHKGEEPVLTLSETIRYAVGSSDNLACDKLFTLLSPKETEAMIHSFGVSEMGIGTNYADMTQSTLSLNHSSPFAMGQLLQKFYSKELLSDSSQRFLWKVMTESQNPADRIKGLLPAGTEVAHKTGTMSREDGVIPAFNDAGIVSLPNGKHFAIVVFINDTREEENANAETIARITKAAWDYFLRK